MEVEVEVLQNTLLTRVNTLSTCLRQFLDELRKDTTSNYVDALLKSLRNLQNKTNFLVAQTLKSNKARALAVKEIADEKKAEVKTLQAKYDQLLSSWNEQQEKLDEARSEMNIIQKRLESQYSRAFSIGSVLGSLLWKASRSTDIIPILLSSDKIESFLVVASAVLNSLGETDSRDETEFQDSVFGILSNIAAISKGRHFITNTKQGNDMISQIVKVLAVRSDTLGNRLRKILLTALYNISINRNGHRILQNDETLLIYLAQVMTSGEITEVEILALQLADAVTTEVTNEEIFWKMKQHMTNEKLEIVRMAADGNARNLASSILSNLSNYQGRFQNSSAAL